MPETKFDQGFPFPRFMYLVYTYLTYVLDKGTNTFLLTVELQTYGPVVER